MNYILIYIFLILLNSVGSFKLILTLSVPQKLKNFIFEIPIIPQILSINNWRTKSARSINLWTYYSYRFRDTVVRK